MKFDKQVNVIIHGAATVRFDEPLKLATACHVLGTKEIMLLAHQCRNLISLVHISTLYSQCLHKNIGEEFYEPGTKTEDFLKMVETNTDEYLKRNLKK